MFILLATFYNISNAQIQAVIILFVHVKFIVFLQFTDLNPPPKNLADQIVNDTCGCPVDVYGGVEFRAALVQVNDGLYG